MGDYGFTVSSNVGWDDPATATAIDEVHQGRFKGCEKGPESEKWKEFVEAVRQTFKHRSAAPLSAVDVRLELGLLPNRQELIDRVIEGLLGKGAIRVADEGPLTSLRYELTDLQ